MYSLSIHYQPTINPLVTSLSPLTDPCASLKRMIRFRHAILARSPKSIGRNLRQGKGEVQFITSKDRVAQSWQAVMTCIDQRKSGNTSFDANDAAYMPWLSKTLGHTILLYLMYVHPYKHQSGPLRSCSYILKKPCLSVLRPSFGVDL